MFLGPIFAIRVAHRIGLDPLFTQSWFYFRWVLAICFSVLAIEIVYYLAPNVEQRKFWRTVPGSIVAVTAWIAASYGLGFYLQHVGDLSKSYETLGAIAGLLRRFDRRRRGLVQFPNFGGSLCCTRRSIRPRSTCSSILSMAWAVSLDGWPSGISH